MYGAGMYGTLKVGKTQVHFSEANTITHQCRCHVLQLHCGQAVQLLVDALRIASRPYVLCPTNRIQFIHSPVRVPCTAAACGCTHEYLKAICLMPNN
jgi:hypothetical protein